MMVWVIVLIIGVLLGILASKALQGAKASKPKRTSKQGTSQRTWQDAIVQSLEQEAKVRKKQAQPANAIKTTLLESRRLKNLEILRQKEFLEKQENERRQFEESVAALKLQKFKEQRAHNEAVRLAEQKAKAESAKAKAEAEHKAKAEAELKAKAEAAKAKAEAEHRAKAEAELEARVEAILLAKAEAEQKAKAEAATAKTETELKAKAEVAKAKAEAELKAKVEVEKAKVEAEQQAKAEAAKALKPQLVGINWHDQQALNLCEEDTSYSTALQARFLSMPNHRCFDVIKGLSSKQDDDVWSQLEQGVKQLDTSRQLLQYIFSYGNMHKAKLVEAYSALAQTGQLQLSGHKIEVFDYGCGQGIATVILLDYLKAEYNLNCSLAQVVLIEPSSLALKRAALHVKQSMASVKLSGAVAAYPLELDGIEPKHLKSCEGTIKFHLFSNILDVPGINMNTLQTKLLASLTGVNYFVCVSPRIWKNGVHERNQRSHNFFLYFKTHCNATLIADRDTDVLCVRNKAHARFERVFRVDVGESKLVNNRLQEADEEEDLSGLFF